MPTIPSCNLSPQSLIKRSVRRWRQHSRVSRYKCSGMIGTNGVMTFDLTHPIHLCLFTSSSSSCNPFDSFSSFSSSSSSSSSFSSSSSSSSLLSSPLLLSPLLSSSPLLLSSFSSYSTTCFQTILQYVNVRAENRRHLLEFQDKLDTSALERSTHPIAQLFKVWSIPVFTLRSCEPDIYHSKQLFCDWLYLLADVRYTYIFSPSELGPDSRRTMADPPGTPHVENTTPKVCW